MKIKIAIGIPTIGSIKSKTALSLLNTVNRSEHEFLPIFQFGGYISENREKIIAVAQDQLCSHVFFVDHDMVFDHQALPLLMSADKDIIGASYNYRSMPRETMVKFYNEEGETVSKVAKMPESVFEAAGIPLGCSLIKMSVFDKLKTPYFPMKYDNKGWAVVSEDIGFCEKAKDEGFKIFCDPTINISHIGDFEF